MLQVHCPYCQSSAFSDKFKLRHHEVLICSECDSWFNPRVTEESAEDVFDETYHFAAQSAAFVSTPRGAADPSADIWRRSLEIIHEAGPGARVVDVGCATGSFLDYLKNFGIDGRGIEFSPVAVRVATEVHHLDVCQGRAEDLTEILDCESIDVVTMWDVIEHVQNVKKVLEAAHRILKPGGSLILATDNYDSFLGNLTSFFYRVTGGVLKYPVERFWIRYNSIYPRLDWLTVMLERHGFSIQSCTGIDYPLVKMNLNPFERLAVQALYALGQHFGRPTQMSIIVRKVN